MVGFLIIVLFILFVTKNGPEWFKRFTHEHYNTRDYDGSKNFIINVIMRNEPDDKKEQALKILNKYWQKYAPSTPHMLLVKAKNIFEIKELVMSIMEKFSVDDQIKILTIPFFRAVNKNTKSVIYPDEIIDIDMTQLKMKYEDQVSTGSIRM